MNFKKDGIGLVLLVVTSSFGGICSGQTSDETENISVLEAMEPLARHRVYPHVDRAQRAEASGAWSQAVTQWRAALDRAPEHIPLVEALGEALFSAGRYEGIESLLDGYPQAGLSELRWRSRTAWLRDDDPPTDSRWVQWLRGASEEHSRKLVETYAFATQERTGVGDALAGLKKVPCPGPGCVLALRLRSSIGEQAQKPREVIASLTELEQWQTWSEADMRRAVQAWLALDDWDALAGYLLAQGRTPEIGLIREAAQSAVGREQWHYARRFLEALKELGQLGDAGRRQLTEVYRELGDIETAAANAYDQEECLRAVELAHQAAMSDTARQWLATCPRNPASTWLTLATMLDATDLLARHSFEEPALEERRIEALAVLLERQNRDNELITHLRDQPGAKARQYLLAALERQERFAEAADIVSRRYRHSGQQSDLERASYFHLLADQPGKAAELLLGAAPFADDEAGRALSQRLLGLYPLPAQDPEGRALVAMATATDHEDVRLSVARTLHRIGLCEPLRGLNLNPDEDNSGQTHMLLGFCLQKSAPGLAVHHFSAARSRGMEEATEPLAVTLIESGQPAASMPLWRALDERKQLSDATRRVWIEAALQAGWFDLAAEQLGRLSSGQDRQWWSMRARTAQGQGRHEEALEYWRALHERWPGSESAFQIGVIQHALGNNQQAHDALAEAVELEPGNAEYLSEFGYVLERTDPERARQAFAAALDQEPWRYELSEQIGYVRARMFQDEAARTAFREAIDRLQPDLAPPELDHDETLKRRYAVRRSHEALGRRWSFSASGWAASGSVPGEFFFDSNPPRNYAQIIADRRLGNRSALGSVHARARLIGQGSADSPLSERAATIGLTWHLPVGVSVVGIDWLEPNHGQGEMLLHGATELFSSGRYRRDWRPATAGWTEQRLYLEGAWWTRSDDYLVSARYDRAWHRVLEGMRATTWYPYVSAEGRLVRDGHDARIGAGLGVRRWTGASSYDAYRRVHSLRLEFQHALDTNIADDNGLFLRLESEW